MKFIPVAVVNKMGRPLLHLQKQSPQVMFAGGVVAAVTSTVLACRATLKLSDTLQKTEELKDKALAAFEGQATNDKGELYDEKKYHKDLTVLKVKSILNVTKLYAPSAGLAMLSIALLTGSHVTLNRRNASLTAAYASVDQAFDKYRQRVVDQLGTDADRDFRYGTEITEEIVEGKDGKNKTVKHTRVSSEAPSKYARFFDELCNDWKSNPEYNRAFLHCQQTYANDMLKARGHIFLNEVYDSLGIPRTKEGAVVGWVLGKGGDNYVDFGIFDDLTNPQVRDFVNGREYSILLDFNVDGIIYDKI
jgi:hypothetical protein